MEKKDLGSAFETESSTNSSAFETESSGSAFETESTASGSAFETREAQSSESTSSTSISATRQFSAASLLHPDTFILEDVETGSKYVLYDEKELSDQGAMGKVSTAIWLSGKTEKKILLKRLNKPADEAHQRLFSNEGTMAEHYGGDNVVKGYKHGECEQFFFLIMEFYDGETLEKKIEQDVYKGDFDSIKKLSQGILRGLAKLHTSDVVHRDIKPANVIIRTNGTPVILDLGLASQSTIVDISGLKKIGTPKYAAPEQQEGKFNCASDIYSFALVIIEAFTGNVSAENIEQFPAFYQEFFRKCVERDPENRFTNADEALDALNNLIIEEQSGGKKAEYVNIIQREIAKRYGDDGILDENEYYQLKALAHSMGFTDEELNSFINIAANEITKFRGLYIIGNILDKQGYDIKKIKAKARKLQIEPAVVDQWLKETPQKLPKIAQALNNQDMQTLDELLRETPVHNPWLQDVAANFSDGSNSSDNSVKKGHPFLILFILALLGVAGYYIYENFISDEIIYKGHNYGTIIDSRDSRMYKTIKIGNITWLAENLQYKTKNSWCENCEKYGRLYTWDDAVDACPQGWTLPTEEHWKNLVNAVGTENDAGKRLKAQKLWENEGNGLNTVGFAALPAGFYSANDKIVKQQGNYARWWTNSVASLEKAVRARINADSASLRMSTVATNNGFSVRCVMIDHNFVTERKGPQLLNASEKEQIKSTIKDFDDLGNPLYLNTQNKKATPLYTNASINTDENNYPILFKGAQINVTRFSEKSYLKANGVWDTLHSWAYDSLIVRDTLDILEKNPVSDTICELKFDVILGNDDGLELQFPKACDNYYEGMPYEISATYIMRPRPKGNTIEIIPFIRDLTILLTNPEDRALDTRDGTVYPLVKIGKQVWFKDNLHYKDSNSTDVECFGNDDCSDRGYLYNWSSAQEACPEGFVLPTNNDWMELVNKLGNKAGSKMKMNILWSEGYEGSNASDFSALPSGYYDNSLGYYELENEYAGWWTATPLSPTEGFVLSILRDGNPEIVEEDRKNRMAVRCLKK